MKKKSVVFGPIAPAHLGAYWKCKISVSSGAASYPIPRWFVYAFMFMVLGPRPLQQPTDCLSSSISPTPQTSHWHLNSIVHTTVEGAYKNVSQEMLPLCPILSNGFSPHSGGKLVSSLWSINFALTYTSLLYPLRTSFPPSLLLTTSLCHLQACRSLRIFALSSWNLFPRYGQFVPSLH